MSGKSRFPENFAVVDTYPRSGRPTAPPPEWRCPTGGLRGAIAQVPGVTIKICSWGDTYLNGCRYDIPYQGVVGEDEEGVTLFYDQPRMGVAEIRVQSLDMCLRMEG